MPQNFEERKAAYYEDLGVPLDPKVFTSALHEKMTKYLKMLDKHILNDPKVRIVRKKNGYQFSISPFEPQPVPENLAMLKHEINQRWLGTGLLDVLKGFCCKDS